MLESLLGDSGVRYNQKIHFVHKRTSYIANKEKLNFSIPTKKPQNMTLKLTLLKF